MKKIIIISLVLGIFFTACDPNEDLYNKLDEDQPPYRETIEYTLTESDYNSFGIDAISDHNAFNDTLKAMDFVPEILEDRFLALEQGSNAYVTYNHLMIEPLWWDAAFGYELTDEDYENIGQGRSFEDDNPASAYLPGFLDRYYPYEEEPEDGDEISIIYNFDDGEADDFLIYLDIYQFDGEDWILQETKEDLPYVGYEISSEDYDEFGGDVAQNNSFDEDNDPENYIPVLLKNKFPMAPKNSEQVVKYRYDYSEVIDKYTFDGVKWELVPYVEERTEQYIHGEIGWAFDPTVTFQMEKDDYLFLAVEDKYPHPEYDDFGYYYGASAFFSNFDFRILGRRLDRDEDGDFIDPELADIYYPEGAPGDEVGDDEEIGVETDEDAAEEEMYRRILEEGFIKVLQNRFPDATPVIGGIEVHYIVQFEIFGGFGDRRYEEGEYKCVEAGDPPQFEFIEGPREQK